MKTSGILFFLVCLLVFTTAPVRALPRFASRVGARCEACHVNPSGGGMRNTFGSTYGREELPIHTYKMVQDTGEDGKPTLTKEDVTNIDDYSTAITPNLSYGGDFRSLIFYEQNTKGSSLFQMQGDLYLDYRLNRQFIVFVDKELYSGFQLFGLARVLPLGGYLKVGQFVPAYGTKIDDHNAFIRGGPYFPTNPAIAGYRQGLIFGERAEQTGVEVGVAPSIFSLQAGLFDGAPFSGLNATGATKFKSFSFRGDATIQSEHINVIGGVSFYNDPNPDPTEKATIYGAFGSVTVLRELTLNGELDYLKTPYSGTDVTGYMTFTELNYRVADGVDLKLGYDFYDPDKNLKTGSSTRITVGAEFFLMSGVEVRPLYRINREQPVEINNNEFDLMFHFYI
ncbi:MAG TPA: hypothetical protein VMG34_13395 [Bacteroidota bacterium]|nr:hypothetical protein [Bacteroidota bacterium]